MSKSRPHREYLILSDNIIVLDHIFNLTKKSNLIGRLYYDLTQRVDNLGVAYFFGPPCRASTQLRALQVPCVYLQIVAETCRPNSTNLLSRRNYAPQGRPGGP